MNELFLPWILTYLVHSTLLIAVLWALDRTPVLRDPVRRERLWRAALLVPLFSASLQVAAPELAIPEPVTIAQTRAEVPAEATERVAIPTTTAAEPAITEPAAGGASMPTPDPWLIALSLWVTVAAWLLLRTAITARAGYRLLGDRRRVVDGIAIHELHSLADTAGATPVALTVSSATPGPLTLPGREICLPARALTLPADELRGMLAHELAHVARGDALQRLAVTLFCAVFCVQPLNFLVRRRLNECAELNADDWARGLLGDGRPLARCLVTVATWLEPSRAPAFAAAMAESDRGLLGRVRRLADAAPQFDGWRGRGALLGLIIVASLAAPGIVMTAAERDGSRSVSFSENGRLHIHSTGDIRFTDDERAIASLEPGKTFRVRDDDHELTVRADASGQLSYEYEIDGDERAFDAEGRAWLAGMIPQLLRATGIQAEERVARIHARGGVDAVLEEIELIRGDFVARRYFVALAQLGTLTGDERVRVYRLAGESIGSDFELRQTLEAFPLGTDSSTEEARALLVAAKGIGSDFELTELLLAVTGRLPDDEAVTGAYIDAAADIGSDFELSRTLSAAVRTDWGRSGTTLRRLIEVSAEIGSDFELSNFLKAVLQAGEPDEATVAAVLELGTEEIGSDHELLQVLKAAMPAVRKYPALRPLYTRAAKTLGDFEFSQAMRTL